MREDKELKDKPIMTRLPYDLYQRLKEVAKQELTTVSHLIRKAIDEYLKKFK